MKKGIVPKPETKFLTVKCKDCGNSQTVFNRATTQVNCQVCGATLAKPTGGKASIQEGHEVQGELLE